MSADHVAEFRARQAETWQKSGFWIALMLGGFVWACLVGGLDSDSSPRLWVAGLLSFGIVGLSVVMVTRVVVEHYRCPNCERLGLQEDGVPLFPGSAHTAMPNSVEHCMAAQRAS